ncbi:OpgC family protein [Yoonia sp. 208BN28-4]|uniref:OpgC family protein n=1 Tax=Yoonia sp. 208BN28-4 TaxID=3126505 RepID=UPI00309948F5
MLAASPSQRVRDPRLDFYRGIAMFIILCAHTPGNFFTSWIPARFGFSDATEIFVFCSGMASAIAFGGSYDRRGWLLGTARVLFRCWQVYWAHICLFMFIVAMLFAINMAGDFETDYIGQLNLGRFRSDPGPQIVGLLTLTYVPNYFDILPMYIGILLMMPLVMALARVDPILAIIACIGIWFLAQEDILATLGIDRIAISLPAEPWSERAWFFNPFAWQLIFFTGFAFVRGWLPRPPVNWALTILALVIVLGNIPLSNVGARELGFDGTNQWRTDNRMWITKSDFGILRYVHFLGLAYLAYVIAGDGGHRLLPQGRNTIGRVWQNIVAMITKVGQQSLAVFVFSMALARLSGFTMDQIGRDTWTVVAVNLIGFALLIVCAYTAAWFKGQPWRKSATG